MAMKFSEWLEAEMKNRGLTQYRVAKLAGLSQAAVSRVVSLERQPGKDFCIGIARAMKIPVETVYRAAGILPAKPEANPLVDEILHLAGQLPPDDLQDLIDLARGKLRRYGNLEDPASSP